MSNDSAMTVILLELTSICSRSRAIWLCTTVSMIVFICSISVFWFCCVGMVCATVSLYFFSFVILFLVTISLNEIPCFMNLFSVSCFFSSVALRAVFSSILSLSPLSFGHPLYGYVSGWSSLLHGHSARLWGMLHFTQRYYKLQFAAMCPIR